MKSLSRVEPLLEGGTLVFEQMSLRFESAMGFHCNRKTERQMTKRTFSLSQMSNDELAQSLPWRENEG